MTAIHSAAMLADGVETVRSYRQAPALFHESNPITRPVIGNPPTFARMAPAGALAVFAAASIGARMRRARGWERHVWWVPQLLATGASVYGAYISSMPRGVITE